MPRTDDVSRLLRATPATIYAALIDPAARVVWLPPAGMHARVERYDARVGGGYRMVLAYDDSTLAGKSGANVDIVEARFVELVPDQRVVEAVHFDSEDPAFAGTMTMTWALEPVGADTRVRITATDVPDGISAADHEAGMLSSLDNLARFTSGQVDG